MHMTRRLTLSVERDVSHEDSGSAAPGRRRERLKQLFHDAAEQPPHARAAFVDAACAGDDELRIELEALLAAHDQAASFLEPAPGSGASAAPASDMRRGHFVPGSE